MELYCETENHAQDNYKKRLRMRNQRENRTLEDQILENKKAKEGMQIMRAAQTEKRKTVENKVNLLLCHSQFKKNLRSSSFFFEVVFIF